MDKFRRTLTGSTINALAGLLMIGAIAFGSTVIRPMTVRHEPEATTSAQADEGTTAGHDGSSADEPKADDGFAPGSETTGSDEEHSGSSSEDVPDPKGYEPPAVEPKDEPTPEPKPEPKAEPKTEPKEEPTPEPAPSTELHLAAGFNADLGKIVVEWSAFGGSLEQYKLVRSGDATATWPLGDGDSLADVVGPDGARRFVDGDVPCGTELHYRVFAVKASGDGYAVVAASNVDGGTRTCEQPTPPAEPASMGLDLVQTADGVQLTWGQCSSEQFKAYKVVRSATNESPTYPLNDGSELIGAVDNHEVTTFTDTNVEAGQTWHYRVLCMGQSADGWYVLGRTDAKALTVE